jgi:hypothetical protein
MSSILELLRFNPFEIRTYTAWFTELAENGRIKGLVAADFLKKSGLSTIHLKQVDDFSSFCPDTCTLRKSEEPDFWASTDMGYFRYFTNWFARPGCRYYIA